MENTKSITIDNEFIQHEAECCIHRWLTKEEYDKVEEALWEGLSEFVYYKIWEVMDIHRILEENKDADKSSSYYRIYHYDYLGVDRIFEPQEAFRDQEDAETFIRYNDQPGIFKIMLVGKDGSEKEVCSIKH